MEELMEIIEMNHSGKTGFCRHYMTLYSVILGMESKNVFEFGSGFSTKTILLALEQTEGKLITCDCRPKEESLMHYFNDPEQTERLFNRWEFLHKRSSQVKQDVENEIFDVVLHDGSHTWREVEEDLRMIIPRMKKGGILMLHDTNHPTENYQLDKALNGIGPNISNGGEADFNFERLKIPYGYGLSIIRILDDFGNGEVNLSWKKTG